MKIVWLFLVSLILAGCAAVQNVTSYDLRTKQYHRISQTLPVSVEQIQGALFQHGLRCRPLDIQVDPQDKRHAYMSLAAMGRSNASMIVLLEFQQSGNSTLAIGYSFYETDKTVLEQWLRAISDPNYCP